MSKGKRFFKYLCLAGALTLTGCAGKPPTHLGQFAPCPDSPNCVSTQATDEKHAIDPIPYAGTKTKAKRRLLEIIHSLRQARLISAKEDYLHVEFVSQVFRFVDDVEFFLGKEDQKIHFRSASRLGYSDLGANRTRMEALRSRFVSSGPTINNKP